MGFLLDCPNPQPIEIQSSINWEKTRAAEKQNTVTQMVDEIVENEDENTCRRLAGRVLENLTFLEDEE